MPSAKKPGACENETVYTFSAAKEVCSKLQNPAKCDLAIFQTNPLKKYFFYIFFLFQMAIIDRTNYNW